MDRLRADASFFLFGALGYPFIEIIWRGYTHPTMALAGGLGAAALFRVNRSLARGALPLRLIASGATVTLIELVFGVIFNLGFGMEVWDYSELPLSLCGQICLPYALLWCLLALPFCLFCARPKRARSGS